MEVIEAIRSRRSIRTYEHRPLEAKHKERLMEAARLAPSGANRQPWQIIEVTNEQRLKDLVPICKNQEFIGTCSMFLAGVDDPNQKWARVDLAIAMDHVSLAAEEMGLGTCWIGAFDQTKLAKFLEVPFDRVITVCMTVGYPAEFPSARSRKSNEDLFFQEKFGMK
ncbi:MAG: nitroreductase A [Methanomassiliicoccales archaeon PtaU1.Bin124]|nr:MAG: nitroreductase A [Methanomassiliicoccales archaeon PtaU1.Bin124]